MRPRGLGNLLNVQLHHFSDASEKGYGEASYTRLVDVSGHIHSGLLLEKARVAPLKLHKFLEDNLTFKFTELCFGQTLL